MVAYGPLIACGTYLVQTGAWNGAVFGASLPLGLLIGAFLSINEFPDYEADLRHGKLTLVARLGRPRASPGLSWRLQMLLCYSVVHRDAR